MALDRKVSEGRGQEHSGCFVPVPVCRMRYINDLWYLERDRRETKRGGVGARKPNMQFMASRTVLRRDTKNRDLVQVVAFRYMKAAEEFSVDCGAKNHVLKVATTHLFEESGMKTEESKYIVEYE